MIRIDLPVTELKSIVYFLMLLVQPKEGKEAYVEWSGSVAICCGIVVMQTV